ncbi:restriction endonuclease subunit S [Acinetobacter lactucae]|uniref:restriction endonuclease subunit S n=1 Tax=Acinetobacter lactucae TaxID=1785128 RepID=UPI0003DF9FE7|nr:restriction endonuclease subunit S [Acinetobacter lactucae]ETR95784.1 type I restriction modification DNA specificity domain protein [Acinetobacter lactucae]
MIESSQWTAAKLEDLFVHVIGGDWGKDEDYEDAQFLLVACIRGSEFKHWKRDLGSTSVIRKVKPSSLTGRKLQEGDILIEISGGGPEQPVGRTVLITEKVLNQFSLPVVCTNFLRLARPSSSISSAFLNYYLQFFYFSGEVVNYQGGSNNLRNLKYKEYSSISIPVPSLTEQKVIADKLDTLLAQVESIKARLERIPEILKQFRQSVLAAAVSGKLTEGEKKGEEHEWQEVATFALDIRYGTSKKCSQDSGETPVLRIPNIGLGVVDHDDLKYADFDKKELETLRLQKGDLLIIRSNGSVDLVGKLAIISESDEHCLFAGYLIRLRLDPKVVDSRYVAYCLQSPQLRQVIELIARSTSGVNNINSKELLGLKIPVPLLDEQREVIERIEKLHSFSESIEKQVQSALDRVSNLTQSILAKAFRGELTAEWREANPELISGENSAEALLKRIKAERESAKPTTKRGRGKA